MKVVRFAFTAVHLITFLLLLGTTINSVIVPSMFPYFNLLSLAFPALLIVHVVLCLWWVLRLKKRALIFIGLTLILIQPIGRWVNWHKRSAKEANLKVVSMNVKSGSMGRTDLYSYLKGQNADILLVQESGADFHVPGYKYSTDLYPIVQLSSKTKILKTEKIATTGNGNAFYADIEFEGKIIRVINVYLNPFAFDKQKVKPTDDLQENRSTVRYIVKRLIPTFKIHEKEIRDIRRAVEVSPYPVILAGDFNSVPNSYEYYQIAGKLTDAFVAVGRGLGTTFHDYKFPIRIDYIFVSPEVVPIHYRVDRSIKLSDHYPVIAEFQFN